MGCDYLADENGVLELSVEEGSVHRTISIVGLEPFAKVYADEHDIPQDAYVDVGARR